MLCCLRECKFIPSPGTSISGVFETLVLVHKHPPDQKSVPTSLLAGDNSSFRLLQDNSTTYEQGRTKTTFAISGSVRGLYAFGLFARVFQMDVA